MGEGESLNEMVRAAGGYEDPAISAATVNALMMAGERGGACAIAVGHPMTEPFGRGARWRRARAGPMARCRPGCSTVRRW